MLVGKVSVGNFLYLTKSSPRYGTLGRKKYERKALMKVVRSWRQEAKEMD